MLELWVEDVWLVEKFAHLLHLHVMLSVGHDRYTSLSCWRPNQFSAQRRVILWFVRPTLRKIIAVIRIAPAEWFKLRISNIHRVLGGTRVLILLIISIKKCKLIHAWFITRLFWFFFALSQLNLQFLNFSNFVFSVFL